MASSLWISQLSITVRTLWPVIRHDLGPEDDSDFSSLLIKGASLAALCFIKKERSPADEGPLFGRNFCCCCRQRLITAASIKRRSCGMSGQPSHELYDHLSSLAG